MRECCVRLAVRLPHEPTLVPSSHTHPPLPFPAANTVLGQPHRSVPVASRARRSRPRGVREVFVSWLAQAYCRPPGRPDAPRRWTRCLISALRPRSLLLLAREVEPGRGEEEPSVRVSAARTSWTAGSGREPTQWLDPGYHRVRLLQCLDDEPSSCEWYTRVQRRIAEVLGLPLSEDTVAGSMTDVASVSGLNGASHHSVVAGEGHDHVPLTSGQEGGGEREEEDGWVERAEIERREEGVEREEREEREERKEEDGWAERAERERREEGVEWQGSAEGEEGEEEEGDKERLSRTSASLSAEGSGGSAPLERLRAWIASGDVGHCTQSLALRPLNGTRSLLEAVLGAGGDGSLTPLLFHVSAERAERGGRVVLRVQGALVCVPTAIELAEAAEGGNMGGEQAADEWEAGDVEAMEGDAVEGALGQRCPLALPRGLPTAATQLILPPLYLQRRCSPCSRRAVQRRKTYTTSWSWVPASPRLHHRVPMRCIVSGRRGTWSTRCALLWPLACRWMQ